MSYGAGHCLFENDHHRCIAYGDLVKGDGIQANQFLIVDGDHVALLDPGGDLTYTPLSIELSRHINLADLDYVLASHQDPDIIASLPRWLMHTQCKVATSKLWARFLPHLASSFVTQKMQSDIQGRLIEIPDEGCSLPLGNCELIAVPAHFLHSVGNFQFYDPVSKILFSGDMGASVGGPPGLGPVEDFEAHIPLMEGFHRRYMGSNRACRIWADMVGRMDIQKIVPQHGRYFEGENIGKFLHWISYLECGIDLLTPGGFPRF